jgi:hypothetical protein
VDDLGRTSGAWLAPARSTRCAPGAYYRHHGSGEQALPLAPPCHERQAFLIRKHVFSITGASPPTYRGGSLAAGGGSPAGGANGTRSRHAGDDAGGADILDRPRSEPAACCSRRQRRSLPRRARPRNANLDEARRSVERIINRGHIMKKMGTRSLADLVRIAEMLGVRRATP